MKAQRIILSFALILMMAAMMALICGCGSSDSTGGDSGAAAQAEADGGDAGTDALKEFGDKPWVFDADYDIPAEVDSYTSFNELYQVSDLVVPYINIDSPDARAANEELYGLYGELIDSFNECARMSDEYGNSGYSVSDYDAYVLDEAVSVLVTQTSGGTDVPSHDYYAYSFSRDDGHLLNYEEACAIAGTTVEEAGETVKENIRESTLKDFSDAPDIDSYIEQSIEEYESSVSDGTIKFVLHDMGLLDVVVKKHFPAGGGSANEVIPAR